MTEQTRPRVRAVERHFPELGAGGFTRLDGTVAFYTRVRALTTPTSVVVDLGAGRGKFEEDPVEHRRVLHRLRDVAGKVVGLDVDDAVLHNPTVDEAHVIVPGRPLPLDDESADVVVADFVFEHVQDPEEVGAEIARILRPGGWICARTPNKRGVVSVLGRIVPNRFHVAALSVVQPHRKEEDTFPTVYRMNSARDLRRCFPVSAFRHFTYTYDGGHAYTGSSQLGWYASRAVSLLTPPPMRPMLFVFVQKI